MGFHNEVKNDQLTYDIIGLAIELHKRLGADLPEHLYRDILCKDLEDEGFTCETEYKIEVADRGRVVAHRFADLIVEDEVILELKAVTKTTDEHLDQLGANLRAADLYRGLLLNFGPKRLEVRRWINPKATRGGQKTE
jgi:GxxExxY protein